MIQKIERKQLDENRYTDCLQSSRNYQFYAEIGYLDSLTEGNWFAYIYNDYEAVMPVCYDTKWMMRRVVQPTYCQQLGLFYKEEIDTDDFQQLFKTLKKNRLKSYQFNSDNYDNYKIRGKKRKNYQLELNKDYDKLRKKFGSNTKRNLKKADQNQLVFNLMENPSAKTIRQYLTHKKNFSDHVKKKTLGTLEEVLKYLNDQNALQFATVNKDNQLISTAAFTFQKEKVYYMNGANSESGKENFASFYLFNECLKIWAEQYDLLDFEGSNDRGIERFFKGWGAKNNPYVLVR